MKKFLATLFSVTLCFVMAISFSACIEPSTNNDAVSLVSITADEIGNRNDVDYYVVPEPAASTKVGAMSKIGLAFAGDLQELYGEENGYPQAVIVAKNTLIENGGAFLTDFLNQVSENESWLAAQTTEASTVLTAISTHLPQGATPTFSAKNLTKSVIVNCSVKFSTAFTQKTAVQTLLNQMNEVATPNSFGTPTDAFFFDGNFNTTAYNDTVKVFAPDGAPALGIAKLLHNDSNEDNVTYQIVPADSIASKVNGTSPEADICVLPVNLASKVLGSGANYKMLGTLTNGNLYMLSKNGNAITKTNIASLKGKTVGIINLANVPGLMFKIILQKNNVNFTELV